MQYSDSIEIDSNLTSRSSRPEGRMLLSNILNFAGVFRDNKVSQQDPSGRLALRQDINIKTIFKAIFLALVTAILGIVLSGFHFENGLVEKLAHMDSNLAFIAFLFGSVVQVIIFFPGALIGNGLILIFSIWGGTFPPSIYVSYIIMITPWIIWWYCIIRLYYYIKMIKTTKS